MTILNMKAFSYLLVVNKYVRKSLKIKQKRYFNVFESIWIWGGSQLRRNNVKKEIIHCINVNLKHRPLKGAVDYYCSYLLSARDLLTSSWYKSTLIFTSIGPPGENESNMQHYAFFFFFFSFSRSAKSSAVSICRLLLPFAVGHTGGSRHVPAHL